MNTRFIAALSAILLLAATADAQAYVGPGVGITLIGSFIGLVATVFCAVGAILMWPIRRLLKKRRERKAADAAAPKPGKGKVRVP